MIPSRDRSVLGAISSLSIVILAYLVFRLPSTCSSTVSGSNLIAALIMSFNLAILFGWLAFGDGAGISCAILSFFLASLLAIKMSLFGHMVLMSSYCVSGALGYGYSKVFSEVERSSQLKYEKINEEIILLGTTTAEKKKSIASLEGKLSRYTAVKEVAESLSTTLSLDVINGLIVDAAVRTMGKLARVLLFLVDVKKQELMLTVSNNASKVKAKKGDSFDRWVLRHRKPLIIEDVTKDFRFPTRDIEEARDCFRSLIATPLISEDKVVGILRMDNAAQSFFTHDDLRLLDIIANLGAVAIQNAVLYAQTQELAIRDGLTGLILRRYFLERLREELKRAARKKQAISVLMVDIDHFKDYNDQYGHTAGDLVLKHLGKVIGSMVKEGDMLARYGGEEFVLLLFGTDKKQAAAEAEAIRRKVEAEPFVLRRERATLTVSIGLSSYPVDGLSEEDLLKIADERLYKAKAAGRNCVCAI